MIDLKEKLKTIDGNNLEAVFEKNYEIVALKEELRALRLIHIRNHKMMNIMLCCFETIDDGKTIKIKDDVVDFTGIIYY